MKALVHWDESGNVYEAVVELEGAMNATEYSITWRLPIEDDPAEVREARETGTLVEIIKECRSRGWDALLYDEQGFRRGRVNADGGYWLR